MRDYENLDLGNSSLFWDFKLKRRRVKDLLASDGESVTSGYSLTSSKDLDSDIVKQDFDKNGDSDYYQRSVSPAPSWQDNGMETQSSVSAETASPSPRPHKDNSNGGDEEKRKFEQFTRKVKGETPPAESSHPGLLGYTCLGLPSGMVLAQTGYLTPPQYLTQSRGMGSMPMIAVMPNMVTQGQTCYGIDPNGLPHFGGSSEPGLIPLGMHGLPYGNHCMQQLGHPEMKHSSVDSGYGSPRPKKQGLTHCLDPLGRPMVVEHRAMSERSVSPTRSTSSMGSMYSYQSEKNLGQDDSKSVDSFSTKSKVERDEKFINHYTDGTFTVRSGFAAPTLASALSQLNRRSGEKELSSSGKLNSAMSESDSEPDEPMICAICLDKATGLHYGIITCEG